MILLATTQTKTRGKGKNPPVAEVRAENEKLKAELERIKNSAYCHMCDKHRSRIYFYENYDPRSKGKVSPICIDCARKIAMRTDDKGIEHSPTKESLIEALRYVDKPFFESLYNSSIEESKNEFSGQTPKTFYGCYMKNIQMPQYRTYRFKDSDIFQIPDSSPEKEIDEQEMIASKEGLDVYDSFQKNKEDVIRLLDYDPFEQESVKDQPLLYSQLLGMLDADGEGNDDMMRIASCVSIVRSFLHQSKIDDAVTKMMIDPLRIKDNSASIKSLESSKGDITRNITNLAAESCISLKNNKNAKKGENTWTGKTKKMKNLNLRESEVNGFDVWTCRGIIMAEQMLMGISWPYILMQVLAVVV